MLQDVGESDRCTVPMIMLKNVSNVIMTNV